MYRRILIATDGSRLSHKAIEEGIMLARSLGSSVVGCHARAPTRLPYKPMIALPQKTLDLMERPGLTAARKYLAAIETLAKKASVAFKGVDVVDPYPADAIISVAKKESCDLIVMASRGRSGLTGLVLGSETNHVLTRSNIPVLVVR